MERTAWRTNKKAISQGLRDLKYLPRGRCGWDASLGALAYGVRMDVERRAPDLNAWAARHGVAASKRYVELGPNALVLWHGTSKQRAERIAEHGLFHKRGLWAASHPAIPHSFCRGRAGELASEGALVCVVLDHAEMIEGRNYDCEGRGDVFRFYHGLPPDVVEYILGHDEIRFVGTERARRPAAWPSAKFKKHSGAWVPVQRAPVRYSDSDRYSSVEEFAGLAVDRLLRELTEVTALEVFSTIYATLSPWDAIQHEVVLDIMSETCVPHRHRGGWQAFRRRVPID